jgi:hypothetical protein
MFVDCSPYKPRRKGSFESLDGKHESRRIKEEEEEEESFHKINYKNKNTGNPSCISSLPNYYQGTGKLVRSKNKVLEQLSSPKGVRRMKKNAYLASLDFQQVGHSSFPDLLFRSTAKHTTTSSGNTQPSCGTTSSCSCIKRRNHFQTKKQSRSCSDLLDGDLLPTINEDQQIDLDLIKSHSSHSGFLTRNNSGGSKKKMSHKSSRVFHKHHSATRRTNIPGSSDSLNCNSEISNTHTQGQQGETKRSSLSALSTAIFLLNDLNLSKQKKKALVSSIKTMSNSSNNSTKPNKPSLHLDYDVVMVPPPPPPRQRDMVELVEPQGTTHRVKNNGGADDHTVFFIDRFDFTRYESGNNYYHSLPPLGLMTPSSTEEEKVQKGHHDYKQQQQHRRHDDLKTKLPNIPQRSKSPVPVLF